MAATKLDGAGAQKMKTLEEAQMSLQSIHGVVDEAVGWGTKTPCSIPPTIVPSVAPMRARTGSVTG